MITAEYYQSLADAYHQVCKRNGGSNHVPNASKRMANVYESRYGYRRTGAGSYVERDEPGETEQLRQADAINKMTQQRRAAASRQRLKSKGAVPTKGGSKLFDEFMREAYAVSGGGKQEKIDHKRMKQIYLSARALEYDQWILFITEML